MHMGPETETVQDQRESQSSDDAVLVEDVLVEEVSIDGMCGVY
jgi:mycofactocin precursor